MVKTMFFTSILFIFNLKFHAFCNLQKDTNYKSIYKSKKFGFQIFFYFYPLSLCCIHVLRTKTNSKISIKPALILVREITILVRSTNVQTCRHADGQTDIQMDTQTFRWTHRHADGQTDKHHISLIF